ncbi:MAG: DUF3108 domain-containing protein [Gammaproteobacteria bacterium]
MTGKILGILSAILAALFLSAAVRAQDNETQIPLYQASYSVGLGSLQALNAHFTLTRNPDGTYTYQSVTKTAGLVALFRNDVVTETSHFKVMDGKLQPLQYTYEHTGKNKEDKENIQFDWVKDVAVSNEDGKQHTLPIKSGIYDRLLAQLAISMDFAADRDVEDYPVLDHNEINIYHMLRQDNTDLKTPAGNYETVVIARRAPHKDRVTTFWLAPKLNYLPVQMEQTEPDKTTISLVLTDIKFDSENSK